MKCTVRTKGHTRHADTALEGFLFDLPPAPVGQEVASELLSHSQGAEHLASNHSTRTGIPQTAPFLPQLSKGQGCSRERVLAREEASKLERGEDCFVVDSLDQRTSLGVGVGRQDQVMIP